MWATGASGLKPKSFLSNLSRSRWLCVRPLSRWGALLDTGSDNRNITECVIPPYHGCFNHLCCQGLPCSLPSFRGSLMFLAQSKGVSYNTSCWALEQVSHHTASRRRHCQERACSSSSRPEADCACFDCATPPLTHCDRCARRSITAAATSKAVLGRSTSSHGKYGA